MGSATQEEAQVLECIQKYNPEVKLAVLEAQKALEEVVDQQAVIPPMHLKSKIWAAIKDAESENIPSSEAIDTIKDELNVFVKEEKSPITKQNFRMVAAAASILLVISIGFIFYTQQRQNKLESQLGKLENQRKQDQQNYTQLEQKWMMSTNPNMKTVILEGVENHPGMKAIVYLEKTTNQTYLSLENLPETPEGFQYQLWAIVDGKPVDAGLYDSTSSSIQKMFVIENAGAFAITLEKSGGNPTPTMEQLHVIGEI